MTDQAPTVQASPRLITPDVEVPFRAQKYFTHPLLGMTMTMRSTVDEMVQRDMDKFLKKYNEQPQGNAPAEDDGKTLRAALRADWIESLVTPKRIISRGDDVDEMHPSEVAWAAGVLNQIFNTVRQVPKVSSSNAGSMPTG